MTPPIWALAAIVTAAITVTIALWIRRMSPEKRVAILENALTAWFAVVVAGLIMQGLVGFAREEMGLTGPWPYLLFAALDGMAALFAVVAYRWSAAGGAATLPRLATGVIIAGSAWFQWAHAGDLALPARVAWTALPIIAAVLWEFLLITRRRAWKSRHTTPRVERIPHGRWLWDPLGSAAIYRRMHLWGVSSWEEALDLHMLRTETIRCLRREYGIFWYRKVPAHIAVRLRKGFHIREAAQAAQELLTNPPESQPQLPSINSKGKFTGTKSVPSIDEVSLIEDDDIRRLLGWPAGAVVVAPSAEPKPDAPQLFDTPPVTTKKRSHPGRRGHDTEKRKEALKMREQNVPVRKIAGRLGVSESTVRRWTKR